jgi:hypothetical protein
VLGREHARLQRLDEVLEVPLRLGLLASRATGVDLVLLGLVHQHVLDVGRLVVRRLSLALVDRTGLIDLRI